MSLHTFFNLVFSGTTLYFRSSDFIRYTTIEFIKGDTKLYSFCVISAICEFSGLKFIKWFLFNKEKKSH